MKSRLIPLVLALSLAAAHAAAGETNDTLVSSFKRNAQKMMRAIGDTPYTGDVDADFMAHMIPRRERTIGQENAGAAYESDANMRRIAEQIETGQTREIDALKKDQNPPPARPHARSQ
jgi:uncharacterized protein (DUF305 family)